MREKKLLSYNLRRLRKLNRYSQDAISKHLKVSRHTYMDMERELADIKAFQLYQLSILYNCSVDEFFYTI